MSPVNRPHRRHPVWLSLFIVVISLGFASGPAAAAETIAREAILIDAETGRVLLDKDADEPMPPSSMSKLMTVYLVFKRLREGSLSMDDEFVVSEYAWREGAYKSGGSMMFLEPTQRVRVEDLLRGIIVQSGNDASIVMAEGIAGSEAAFAAEMNEMAREIGLTGSNFTNSTGLPDPEHYMTARDLATLANRIINDFPEYYPIYSETEFTYNGHRQRNRNPLLYNGRGADGLKTGYTSVAGYGLTASTERNGRRLILVVNGLDSKRERAQEPARLLDWGFREFGNYELFTAGETAAVAPVWLGEAGEVPLVIEQDLLLTLPRKARADMAVTIRYDSPIPAPVQAGERVAELIVSAPGEDDIRVPLVAGSDVAKLGLVGRLGAALDYLLWGSAG